MESGTLIMGRFRVQQLLGSGGMGRVYLARDERLQRDVAIKEVQAPDPARIRREAKAAARLNHPNVVGLFEFGSDEQRAILVCEYVPGNSLEKLFESDMLSDREVAEIGADVARGLEHAHERGVVHRDIKPANVLVEYVEAGRPRAKIADFGIAAVADSQTLTRPGEVVGTLAYMSPEQAFGEAAGPATDIYSLALVLYEALTGFNPVRGDSPAETARLVTEPVDPVANWRDDLPAELSEILDAALDPDPGFRPDAREFSAALTRAAPRLSDLPASAPAPAAPVLSGFAWPARIALGAAAIAVPFAPLPEMSLAWPALIAVLVPWAAVRVAAGGAAWIGLLALAMPALSSRFGVGPAWPPEEPLWVLGLTFFALAALVLGYAIRMQNRFAGVLLAGAWAIGSAAVLELGLLGQHELTAGAVFAAVAVAAAAMLAGTRMRPREADGGQPVRAAHAALGYSSRIL